MATECCGKARKSAYCPDCGAKLETEDPLVDLLTSCRKSQKAHENSARRNRERHPDWIPTAEESERKAAQWKARGDALAAMMLLVEESIRPAEPVRPMRAKGA